jgi:sugar phosphate isomerase/epimerase
MIGVIYDPANTVLEGSMDLNMGLDIVRDYVDLVHVKNVRWEHLGGGEWRWGFDELADGGLDWAETIAALKRIGYDGYLSFENLYRVPVTHQGYIAEDLRDDSVPPRDIDQRLSGDLAYIRGLAEGA